MLRRFSLFVVIKLVIDPARWRCTRRFCRHQVVGFCRHQVVGSVLWVGLSVKMIGEGRKKGIKNYADLIITKDDLVLPFDKGDTTWDEKKIVSRTEQLIGEINSIWKKVAVEATA